MTTFTDDQVRQQLEAVLGAARTQGEVRVKAHVGQEYTVRPVAPLASPFDVPGVDPRLSAEEIVAILEVDHRHSEHILAFDTATGELIATLLLLADSGMESAEVTVSVAADWKGRGIGWTLLRHASDLAQSRGVKKLRSVESRANHDALEVERALGFHAQPVEGDPSLVQVEMDLA